MSEEFEGITPDQMVEMLKELGMEGTVIELGDSEDAFAAAMGGFMKHLGQTLSREEMAEYIYGTMNEGLQKFTVHLFERKFNEIEEFCSAFLIVLTMFMAAVRRQREMGTEAFIAKYGVNGDIDHFFGKEYDYLDEHNERMHKGREILRNADFGS